MGTPYEDTRLKIEATLFHACGFVKLSAYHARTLMQAGFNHMGAGCGEGRLR